MRPAHISGAASASEYMLRDLEGIGGVGRRVLRVAAIDRVAGKAGPLAQVLAPRRQKRQRPHVPPSQGMPTRSPILNPSTPAPIAATRPMISWPGMTCGLGWGRSPSMTCRSVRQMPHAATRTRICPRLGGSILRSTGRSGAPARSNAIADMRVGWLALSSSPLRVVCRFAMPRNPTASDRPASGAAFTSGRRRRWSG